MGVQALPGIFSCSQSGQLSAERLSFASARPSPYVPASSTSSACAHEQYFFCVVPTRVETSIGFRQKPQIAGASSGRSPVIQCCGPSCCTMSSRESVLTRAGCCSAPPWPSCRIPRPWAGGFYSNGGASARRSDGGVRRTGGSSPRSSLSMSALNGNLSALTPR